MTPNVVIPAKAGIQYRWSERHWVPAFAGTTTTSAPHFGCAQHEVARIPSPVINQRDSVISSNDPDPEFRRPAEVVVVQRPGVDRVVGRQQDVVRAGPRCNVGGRVRKGRAVGVRPVIYRVVVYDSQCVSDGGNDDARRSVPYDAERARRNEKLDNTRPAAR